MKILVILSVVYQQSKIQTEIELWNNVTNKSLIKAKNMNLTDELELFNDIQKVSVAVVENLTVIKEIAVDLMDLDENIQMKVDQLLQIMKKSEIQLEKHSVIYHLSCINEIAEEIRMFKILKDTKTEFLNVLGINCNVYKRNGDSLSFKKALVLVC